MSRSFIRSSALALGAASLGVLAPVARAGVVYAEQGRQVTAEASHRVVEPEITDVKTAPGFGAFDAEARAHLTDPFDLDFATATVTQNSRLQSTGVSAAGSLVFDIGGNGGSRHCRRRST